MTPLLLTHVAAGTLALLTGVVAMVWPKNQLAHRQIGRIYFYMMLVVFLTALPLAWTDQNWFLISISFFSFHMALTGYRQARLKGRLQNGTDQIIGLFMLGISLWMVGMGIQFWIKGLTGTAMVIGVFGLISTKNAIYDVRLAFGRLQRPKPWVRVHLGRMGGSYIAATTAFAVNTIDFWPPVVTWLLPTVVGSILLSIASRRFRKRNKLKAV